MTTPLTLDDVAAGDVVALYQRDGKSLAHARVDRCTKTRITVNGQQFTRKGRRVGDTFRSSRIEVWNEEKHGAEFARRRAQAKLDLARYTLSKFEWTKVTQAQADAVLATMKLGGMIEED